MAILKKLNRVFTFGSRRQYTIKSFFEIFLNWASGAADILDVVAIAVEAVVVGDNNVEVEEVDAEGGGREEKVAEIIDCVCSCCCCCCAR